MLTDTIKRIEHEISYNKSISSQKRNELMKLLGELKIEINELSKSDSDKAKNIAKITETSVQVATSETPDQELLDNSLNGMKLSVRTFEVTHPKLVGLINTIGQTLNNIGI
ncbi:MAG: DUF4404 family protein [Fibrobacter sp.]|nr:DUF4404 family protein [Fibrobacter sp.]